MGTLYTMDAEYQQGIKSNNGIRKPASIVARAREGPSGLVWWCGHGNVGCCDLVLQQLAPSIMPEVAMLAFVTSDTPDKALSMTDEIVKLNAFDIRAIKETLKGEDNPKNYLIAFTRHAVETMDPCTPSFAGKFFIDWYKEQKLRLLKAPKLPWQ
ncbi:MAG: hypothetical protein IBX50_07680 [Marinospirillum sp.]|uniref:hypothetical protein n=1 Tax=Marinospirillum sp. TaxID=2183934 RepID=UPI001A0B22E4|nr:hypothetical protein [Marinospirillum sp.]MBE0506587.1 hypothetical protein [Marinospirillum sp.]